MLRHHWVPAFCFLFAIAGVSGAGPAEEFFENKVRPVLVDQCFKCHSEGEGRKIKGGLRLDTRAGLLKGGESGPSIVPGDPDKSLLVKAIRYQDDLQMPPKGKLADPVVADIVQWVKDGAVWPGDTSSGPAKKEEFNISARKAAHWSWRPLADVQVPAGQGDPIDRLLAAARQANGVGEAPPASKVTILRRLSFDLTGLPPTAQELEAFLADESPSALDRQVDRLLASPRFGEHWARHWLDLVRYAETRGHEFDFHTPNAWQYRDYIIRALNADLPYNQLLTEHLAGDLLKKPRLNPEKGFNESVLGTGFFFLGEEVHSPVDVRQDEADRFDNRIDVLGKTFLGLTVACARCHDHKFDAISAADYYSLYAVLESTRYRLVRFDAIEAEKKLAEELAALRFVRRADLAKALQADLKPLADQWEKLVAAVSDLARKYQGKPTDPEALAAIRQRAKDDQLNPAWIEKLVTAAIAPNLKPEDPLRALLTPPAKPPTPDPATRVLVDYASLVPAQWIQDGESFGPGPATLGAPRLSSSKSGWSINTETAARRDAFWPEPRIAPGQQLDPGSLAYQRAGNTLITPTFTVGSGQVKLLVSGKGRLYAAAGSHVMVMGPLHGEMVAGFDHGDTPKWAAMNLARYAGLPCRIEITTDDPNCRVLKVVEGPAPQPAPALIRPDALPRWLQGLSGGRQRPLDPSEAALIDRALAVLEPAGPATASAVDAWRKAEDALKQKIPGPSRLAVACADITGINEKVFVRGSHKVLGADAPRRFLEAVDANPLQGTGSGRLELAEKMTNPALTPQVPRVAVNRIWHHLFGRGLVPSVDNFGVLGEEPTHPQLLDYLAASLVRDGWSFKKLIRQLVLTRAYAMSTRGADADLAKDPSNQWLSHARVRRLSGEEIRDALLMLSGRLDTKMFGEPVPPHIGDFQDGRGKPGQGPLDGSGRRSIYLGVRRNFLSPWMLAFDTPAPFSTMGRRATSNVPAQSLVLMNDPLVRELCVQWAARVAAESPAPAGELIRARRMAIAAYGRQPTEKEWGALVEFLAAQKASGAPEPERLAALAHALVNTREFIYLR